MNQELYVYKITDRRTGEILGIGTSSELVEQGLYRDTKKHRLRLSVEQDAPGGPQNRGARCHIDSPAPQAPRRKRCPAPGRGRPQAGAAERRAPPAGQDRPYIRPLEGRDA